MFFIASCLVLRHTVAVEIERGSFRYKIKKDTVTNKKENDKKALRFLSI